MNIKPYDIRIQQLFLSSFYKIPRFQRPYSWDKENIDDFWSDVIAPQKVGHFIGSMVLYSGKGGSDLFIVDGQQRLTTITIFFAALRDAFISINESKLANGVQSVIERQDISNNLRYVLLTETSFPYFQEYVQKLGKPDVDIIASEEEAGIQSAYKFALDGFMAMIEGEKAKINKIGKHQEVSRRILEKCREALLSINTIVIQLDNEDDAYVVFETLNTRGKDLEPKDLIKNLLTRALPQRSVDYDAPRQKWNSMVRQISNSEANIDVSTYLHHFWLAQYDYTPERTLFDRVKANIRKADASNFLDSLLRGVEYYRRIFEPENLKWSKEEEPLKRSLQALNIFRVRQPAPLLLAIIRSYKQAEISLKQAKDAVASIERFHFLNTAVAGQSSSGGVSKMYAVAARGLTNEVARQERAAHIQAFCKKLSEKYPDRDKLNAGLYELRYSDVDTRDRQLVRYILEKVDTLSRKGLAVDYSKMTIEHISPQKPLSGQKRVILYASVGNLILLDEALNGTLANKAFAEKKAALRKAKYPDDENIDNATTWGDKEIKLRNEKLADLLFPPAPKERRAVKAS